MTTVDAEKIQRADGMMLAGMLLSTIERYFDDPAHQKEFERWQQERKNKIRRFHA